MASSPAKETSKVATIDEGFSKVLDRFGALDLWIQQNKPKLDEHAKLKKLIRERLDGAAPADQPYRAEGLEYYVDLGQKENQREITDPVKCFNALKKALGLDALVRALKYTLKLIDAHVSPEEQKKFVKQERTGARDVTAVLKSAPTAA